MSYKLVNPWLLGRYQQCPCWSAEKTSGWVWFRLGQSWLLQCVVEVSRAVRVPDFVHVLTCKCYQHFLLQYVVVEAIRNRALLAHDYTFTPFAMFCFHVVKLPQQSKQQEQSYQLGYCTTNQCQLAKIQIGTAWYYRQHSKVFCNHYCYQTWLEVQRSVS